jgi:LPXTG-motif cell wall-anchored protein
VQTSTGGFPIQVLLVLGGMMGAIAIFILFKARK